MPDDIVFVVAAYRDVAEARGDYEALVRFFDQLGRPDDADAVTVGRVEGAEDEHGARKAGGRSMSGIEMVRSARKDVEQLQSALTAVDDGLETVEVAAEAVDAARRGFSRVLRILLVIGLVGLVVGIVAAAGLGCWSDQGLNRVAQSVES